MINGTQASGSREYCFVLSGCKSAHKGISIVFDLKSQLVLQAGETIKIVKSSTKGFMQETDLMTYDVVDASGKKVGSVEVEDHTAVNGFRRTVHFVQRDLNNKVLVDRSWSG